MKKRTQTKRNRVPAVKNIFLTLILLVLVAVTQVQAAANPVVNEKVKAAFNKEFAGAQLISWATQGELLKATFIFGSHRTEAYFRENGQLEGSIRSLFYNQLPLVVMTSVDKRFANAEIQEVSEINNASGTTYQLSLTSKQKNYKVQLDPSGSFIDIEKVKK